MLSEETKQHYLSYLKKLNQKATELGITLNPEDFTLEILPGDLLILNPKNSYDNHHKLNQAKYEQIKKSMNDEKDEQGEDFSNVLISFFDKLGIVGSNFVPCEFRHIATKEVRNVEHTQGQVLILFFWTWCGSCILSMNNIYKMIEKNFDSWNGKVKFITASVVEDIEGLQKFMTKNNWDRFETVIDHFIIMSNEGNDLRTHFNAESIPYYVIVDKFGVFQFSGKQGSVKYEEKINHFINQEVPQEKPVSSSYQQDETNQKLKVSLIENLNSFRTSLKTLNYNPRFYTDFRFRGIVSNSDWSDITLEIPEGSLKLDAELRQNEINELKNIIIQLLPDYESCDWFSSTFEVLEVFNICPVDSCTKCNNAIPEDRPMYYSHWSKKVYCENCAESPLTNEGRAKLVDQEHNLLYFKTRDQNNLSNLDLFKLGTNLFATAHDRDLKSSHEASCNGKCNKSMVDCARFICMTCLPGFLQSGGFYDYCGNCINVLNNPGHPDYETVKSGTPGHNHETHVYLRLVFNAGDYYNY